MHAQEGIAVSGQQPRRPVKEELWDVRTRYILDVAREVLFEQRYEDASMDEIATRVGIAKGTLYQHFPSKRDLLLALFETHLTEFERAVNEAAATPGTARVRLTQVVRHVYRDRPGAYPLLLLLTRNVELRRSLGAGEPGGPARRWEEVRSRIARMLEEGVAEGSFAPGLPTGLMLNAFLGCLLLGRPQTGFASEHLSEHDLGSHAARILFDGIGSTRGGER